MKTGRLFWGILLVTIGGLILLNNLAPFEMNWFNIWKLWPLVLILFGLFFLIRNSRFNWVLVALSALMLGTVIFSGVKTLEHFFWTGDFYSGDFHIDEARTEEFSETYTPSIKTASLDFDAGAGNFDLKGETGELIYVRTIGGFGGYVFEHDTSDDNANLSLQLENRHVRFDKGFLKNKVDIQLNINPLWKMNFEVGAASVDMDLTPFKVEDVIFSSGAASIMLKLGSLHEDTRVKFESGASSIKILIPRESGCEINTETALSRKNFEDFEKFENGYYRTANFNQAKNKIHLEIDAGISSVSVTRY